MTRVVILRPKPGASETLERAKSRGLEVDSIPLFTVEPIDWTPPEASSFDAVLLTSANAVRCGGDRIKELRGLPAHAVGKATADAAREAGFDIASTGTSGVERLLGSLEADLKLLHIAGEDRIQTPEARQKITSVPVYRSRPIDPAPDLAAAKDGVVLVHSPRAAKRFAELADAQGLKRADVRLAAISAAAAEAAGSGWRHVATSGHPTDEGLLALAEQLCDNRPQG